MLRTHKTVQLVAVAFDTPRRDALRLRSVTFVIAGIALIQLAQPAAGAVTLSVSNDKPTENVYLEFLPGTINNVRSVKWTSDDENGSASGRVTWGQTFPVSGTKDIILDKFTIAVREFGTAVVNQPFSFELYHYPSPSALTGDVLVSNQAGVFPAFIADYETGPSGDTGADFWTFDIDNLQLTAGHQYGFFINFDAGPDAERFFNPLIEFDNGSGFLDGVSFYRYGTPVKWGFGSTSRDLNFQLQTVPEPSTLLLALCGAGGLAFCTWRNRKRQ